ncbi:MAG: thiopurine S-methyltransferase [Steroidobacteraceae bacterium]
MHPEFWHERWRTGQIGFHQSGPHPFLERWWPSLGVPAESRVYVPLCGKSLDMVWLAVRGHRIVGSELSEIAVREFFGEHASEPAARATGPFRVHAAGPFEIFEGDALALTPELLGPVAAAYDRAALVALPAPLRRTYADLFATLLPASARSLLVTFEYDQSRKAGPPFAVAEAEVHQLYGTAFVVERLDCVDIIEASPKFAEAGVGSLHEVAYALRRR